MTFILLPASAQDSRIVHEFKPACDSISKAIKRRTTIKGELKLKAVMKRDELLDFYFTNSLGDYPWHEKEVEWFRDTLKKIMPRKYKTFEIGDIYSEKYQLDSLVVPYLTFRGGAARTIHTVKKPKGQALVREVGQMRYSRGLNGRHIALWQSHGRYFDVNSEMWRWQRPMLFQTCEDMFTQSYVLNYLAPMLENAGAYVMLPRERDTQTNEVIADNDSTYDGFGGRIVGSYEEHGAWKDAGTGFADTKAFYTGTENPFKMGSARKAPCVSDQGSRNAASIIWRADIPERGEYAVYVSYKTLAESTSSALYTVHHLGGESSFVVNQRMGGSTWIYLGTFEFDAGTDGYVCLTNKAPEGYGYVKGRVVTADAVRFGGGMGNIARSRSFDAENDTIPHYDPVVSGMPRSAEAARYWLQWAGVPDEIYSQNDGQNDYKDDYMSRGDWVAWMSGRSVINPKKPGRGIPFDLALGFHSDAGVTPDSTVVGTLSIYTSRSEDKTEFPDETSRMTSRLLADFVQSQIVHDLRKSHNPIWNRRLIWDRGYRESRTPTCPSMLLELLSHQNFSDMMYGLDPEFQFTTGRAVYKGILKYLSSRYQEAYTVQPLPVRNLALAFVSDTSGIETSSAILSWDKVDDPLEPTAKADGYILYRRLGNGAFDKGTKLENVTVDGNRISATVDIAPGEIYSYRVAAYNRGGRSFQSETVSIGIPHQTDSLKGKRPVLIVNNFDRISGPAYYINNGYAGFLNDKESGVPYIRDISFCGAMYDFNRAAEYRSDTNPGFGASYGDHAGKTMAGNTFDYIHIHGEAVLAAGHPFYSCGRDIFCSDPQLRASAWAIDLICGKQLTTVKPDKSEKFKVYTYEMMDAIKDFTAQGGNIIVSGAYIGTDIWSNIYPVQADTTYTKTAIDFARNTLGYRYDGNYGSRNGSLRMTAGGALRWTDLKSEKYIYNTPNRHCYHVGHPDSIRPSSKASSTVIRYGDTGASAGTAYSGAGYKAVCFGFPLETMMDKKDIRAIVEASLEYLAERQP